jgi:hypothetical protein
MRRRYVAALVALAFAYPLAWTVKAAEAERPAVPVRLVGLCDGRMMAAMEESAFPAGCDWIAPLGGMESADDVS